MSKINDQPVTIGGGFIRLPVIAGATQLASELNFSAEESSETPGRYVAEFTEPVDSGYDVRVYYGADPDGVEVDQGGFSTLLPGQTTIHLEDTPRTSTIDFFGTNYFWVYIVDATTGVVSSSYYYGAITIKPVLSNEAGVANGDTGYTGTVDTTSDTGTLYWFVSTSATPPSDTDLKAGTGAVDAGSQAVAGFGTQNVSGSGLTASTGYYIHYLHEITGADSAIVSSSQFTTAGAATVPSAFGDDDWTLIAAASSGGNTLQIDVQTLPNNGGATITDIEYRLEGGSAVSLSSATTGLYNITVTADTETDVEIRAVNSVGDGAWSNVQTQTPQRSGGSEVSSFDIDGRTFTLDGTYSIVRHIDGPVAIVSSSAVGVTPPSASQTGRDGVMINPQFTVFGGSHGYDSRRPNYSSGLNAVGGETSLSPGDVMMASFSDATGTAVQRRDGYTRSYQAVYVTSTEPDPDSLAPPMIGWASRTSIDLETAPNWDTLVSSIPTYTVTGGNQPGYNEIVEGVRFNPGMAQYPYAFQGYEDASPTEWGGPSINFSSTGVNYGQFMGVRLHEAAAALMDNSYSSAERKEILIRLASCGKQTYITLVNSSRSIGADGGHYQGHSFLIFLYFWVTGQDSAIASMFNSYGGNWKQAFLADSTYVSNLAPFGSVGNLTDWATYPTRQWTFHRRTFTRSGNNASCTVRRTSSQGDADKGRWPGLILTDGTNEALVTSDGGGDRTDGEVITITCDDLSAFSSSFTGWLKPEYTITAGDPVWGIRGTGRLNHVIPNSSTSYIGQQKWAPFFLFIYNVGAMVDNFLAPASFSREATQSNQPSSTNDWSSHLQSGTNAEALYNQHQSTIFAISQPNLS